VFAVNRLVALIREFGSIERIMEAKGDALKPEDDFDYALARRVFNNEFEIPSEWHKQGRWDAGEYRKQEVGRFLSGFEPGNENTFEEIV
jgi:hypothetical protein